ncbi:hypothetical protein C0991_000821, partial [Blastosporella zonata]
MSDVGGYIYVTHCFPVDGCNGPTTRQAVLEQYESARDNEEQEMMGKFVDAMMVDDPPLAEESATNMPSTNQEVSNPELLAGICERILLATLSKEDTVALLEDDELDIEDDSDQVGERQHGGDSEGLRLWVADVSGLPPAGAQAGGGGETASDTGGGAARTAA